MKKKNKIIIGSLSAIGVGSIILAPALGSTNYNSNNNQQTKTKVANKQVAKSNLATNDYNQINSHTFNDNAYLTTLNQKGIPNPVGKVWTTASALSYYTSHLATLINVFGCAAIFRWVVIQNFNHTLNELTGTLSANSNFNIAVSNFNYNLSNIKYSSDISKFNCTLNFNVTFTITSKQDNGTLTFTNAYTYNNLKLTPVISAVGLNAYGAFNLTNDDNSLNVNSASYFENMKMSGNWSNSDFTNLLQLNWLPTINESTAITTSNYTYALSDMVQRALRATNLNNMQSQFVNALPSTMIDTFNIGYKFANAANLVIQMDTKGISQNAANEYNVDTNTNITLDASSILSSINLKNPDLTFQWQEYENGSWLDIAGATNLTYTFMTPTSSTKYRLYATNTKNNNYSLGSNTIIINPVTEILTIDSVANTNDYDYGANCTLQINHAKSNYGNNTIASYQWYSNASSATTNGTAISGANGQNATYSFDVTNSSYYYLVLTFKNGSTLTSNSYYVTANQTSISVENLTPSSSMTSNGEVYNGSTVTLGISKKDMDWLDQNGGKNLTYTWYQQNPVTKQWQEVGTSPASTPGQFSFNINQGTPGQYVKDAQGQYKVVITNSKDPNYQLPSSPVSLTTNSSLSLTPYINGNPVASTNPSDNSNYYQGSYGDKVGIKVNTDHWNTTGWKYQWQYYDPSTGKWENVTGTGANSPDYNYQLNGANHSTYRLQINDGNLHMNSNPITVTSKPIATKVTNDSTGNEVTGPVQQGEKVTISANIPNTTSGSSSSSSSSSMGGKVTYQWQEEGPDGEVTDIPGATSPDYSLPANKDGTYRLKITNSTDPNNPTYTPWQSVTVTNNYPLVIQATDSTSMTSNANAMSLVAQTYEYNSTVTLSMNTTGNNWNNQPGVTGLIYSWYEVGNTTALVSSSTATTYSFPLIQDGNQYYLVITNSNGFKLTSNIITINYENQSIKIDAAQSNSTLSSTNNIAYGSSVSLNFVDNSNNFVLSKSFTYQWQMLQDGNTWTNDGTATTSPSALDVNVVSGQSYRLVIMDGSSQIAASNVITLSPQKEPLYITNTASSSSTSSSTTNSSSTQTSSNSTMSVNYGDSSVVLGTSGYWATQKLVDSTNFSYQWQSQQPGTSTWSNITTDGTSATYKVPSVTTSGISYRLIITDSKINGFKLTSAPLTINLNKVDIMIEATAPASGTSYTFGKSVTLSINGTKTTGVTLNSSYTYTWQYEDSATSTWTTFPQTSNSNTLDFSIIRNSTFRLYVTNSTDGFSAYSNVLTLNCTNPTETISATDASSSTPATSFDPLTNITLTTSTLTAPSGTTLTYSWTNLSDASNPLSSTTNTQKYLLTAPLTAQATYQLTNKNNAYYDYSFNSSPISIQITKQPLAIVSTGSSMTNTANSSNSNPTSTANTYDLGSTVKLSVDSTNYWDTFSQSNLPTGYTLKYQWYNNATSPASAITNATDPTYSFTLNDDTAHGYYLEVSCVNSSGKVVYSQISNVITPTISSASKQVTITYNPQTSSDVEQSNTVYYGSNVTLLLNSNDPIKNVTGLTYTWYEVNPKTLSIANGTKVSSDQTYSFDAISTTTFILTITGTGINLQSNPLTIAVDNTLVLASTNTSSTPTSTKTTDASLLALSSSGYSYGQSVTLSPNSDWNTYLTNSDNSTYFTYQWNKLENGKWESLGTNATSIDYVFDAYQSGTYQLVATYKNGKVTGSIEGSVYVLVSAPTATITATPTSTTYGFADSVTSITSGTSNDDATIDFGQSVDFTTSLTGATLNSNWTYTWQYLDQSTNEWAPIANTTANETVSDSSIAQQAFTCYQTGTYRIELINSKDASNPIYSDTISITVMVPKLQINIAGTSDSTASAIVSNLANQTGPNIKNNGGGSTQTSSNNTNSTNSTNTTNSNSTSNTSTTVSFDGVYGEAYTLSVDNSNYWLQSVSGLSGLTYQWYEVGTGAISGATQSSYKIDSLTSSGVYYCVVKDSNDASFSITSNNIVISTNTVATITATPTNTTYGFGSSTTSISSATSSTNNASIDYGQSVKFSVSVDGIALSSSWTYTWQYLGNGSGTWQTLTGTTAKSAVSGTTITTTNPIPCYQSGTYRIELVDGTNAPIYSGIISINVNVPKLMVNATSSSSTTANENATLVTAQANATNNTSSTVSLTGTYGDAYTLSVDSSNYWLNSVSDLSGLTYQWYEAGTGAISGATQSSYNIDSLTSSGVYYCIVKDSNDSSFSITSNNISISVNPVATITATAANSQYAFSNSKTTISSATGTTSSVSIDYGQSVTFSVSETGLALNSSWTYTWQYLDKTSNTWQTLTGTTADSNVSESSIAATSDVACYESGLYRIELVDGTNSPIYSGTIAINVMVPKLIVNVTSTATTSSTVAKNSTLTADTQSATSNSTASADATVSLAGTYGDSYTLSVDSTNYWLNSVSSLSDLTYQWYEAGHGAIEGANKASYTISSLTANGVYYCIVKDGNDSSFSITSNNIDITVNPSITITATPVSSTYGFGSSTTSISASSATTNSTNYATIDYGQSVTLSVSETGIALNSNWTYTWQYLDQATGSWQTVSGTIANNKVTGTSISETGAIACYQTGTYRIELVDGSNSPLYSGIISITVMVPKLAISVAPSSTTNVVLTSASNADNTTSANSTKNTITYQYGDSYTLSIDANNYWLSSVCGLSGLSYQWYEVGVGAITNQTSASYTISSLQSSGSYYCEVTNSNDPSFSLKSNIIAINLAPQSSPNITYSVQTTADNENAKTVYGESNVTLSLSNASVNSFFNNLPNTDFTWYLVSSQSGSADSALSYGKTYSFNIANTSTYYLQVSANGKTYTSNYITIVVDNNLTLNSTQTATSSNSTTISLLDLSTGEFGFGTNVTISPTTGWYQYLTNSDNSSNFTYQWNKLENGTWTPLSSNATSIDYSFTAYQTGTYQLAVSYNGNTCFTGSINIPVTTPTAVISASPVNSGTYQTFNNNTPQITSAKDNLSAATIDYGQSITISAALTGGRHSVKSWTYTWQYLDQASGTWQTLSGTNTAQLSTSFQASIDSFTCYQTTTYRIQFVNSGDSTYPIYSGIITVNVNVPPLTIVKNGSKLNIESTNYWLGNVSNLQNTFTYSWYKVGDTTALTQSQTATSYTPTSSGTYYCVVTDPNDPNTSFAVTSNYVDFTLTPKAVITASPQGLGFVTASGTLSSNTVVSSSASIASIDFGQSVQLTASITGETLNSNWTYTWQYLDQTTGTWQGISTIISGNATGQVTGTNNLVAPVLFTCYQTETYRLEVTNSNDPDSTFYSGLISIDVIQPKLMINIASANSANESAIASNLASSSTDSSSTNNSTSQTPTSYTYGNAYTLSIESGNYWLTSVNGLSGLTYTWYEVGNTSALQTSSTLTSYTISSLTSNGTYYCVVTDSNYPALSVTSNQINVSVSPAVIITATPTNSTYGFGTTTTSISSPSTNSTATATNYATIDYGQSVKFSASVEGLTLNSNWTYTWQYLDAASGSWKTITGTTANTNVTGTTITVTGAIACYQTGSYRIMLTDGKNAPIYSGIVSINVTVPSFEINVTNENTGVTATTNSVTYSSGTLAQFGIVSTNYWASSEGAANISDLTYSWYAAGNSNPVDTGTTYTTAGLLASGSYYCVITNTNDPSFSVTSNIIVVNTSTDFTINMRITPVSSQWGVTSSSDYGFLTSTGEVSKVQHIITNSDDTSTYLYYGESVIFSSDIPSNLRNYASAVGGAWKTAYQYFDQASNSWQTVPSTAVLNGVIQIGEANIECFQTATYRIKVWDTTNSSYSFYSPTLTVNLIKPKLDITVSDATSSSTPSIYQYGGKYVLNVSDNNFWNQNVSMLPQNWETDGALSQQNNLTDYTFTYTWYEVGNPDYLSQIVAKNTDTNQIGYDGTANWTACDTSYTINSLTSSGSYYCVITNNVNSNFSVTSNIIQMDLPSATITATPTSSNYGFVNASGQSINTTSITSANSNDDFATIDYGQSVTFNASVDGVTLNSDWTYTWQYLDPSSDSWQTVSGATANAAISGSTISSFTAACYKPYAYRIELTNSKLDDSIYSGIILINTYTPSLQISVPNDNATTIALNHNIILKGSGHQQPITPEASIVSNNYWLPNVGYLNGLVYAWYQTGGTLLDSGANLTSYPMNESGSYYLIITDTNDPGWSIQSNTVNNTAN